MKVAAPVFITRDICELIHHAAKSYQPEVVEPEWLLFPEAFAWLEKPYHAEGHEDMVGVQAVHWMTTDALRAAILGAGMKEAPPADDLPEGWGDGVIVTPLYYHDEQLVPAGQWFFLPFGTDWRYLNLDDDSARFIGTLWSLLMQKIAVTSSQRAERSIARRVEREQIVPEVNIVTLRKRRVRKNDEDAEPMDVDWSHRWIVNGFWRDQWYPSLGQHHQIWINDYVKGPEDLPLIVKGKIYKWSK